MTITRKAIALLVLASLATSLPGHASDMFGNGTIKVPTSLSGGTGTVANLQSDDDVELSVAKSATATIGGFGTYGAAINSVYLFVQYSVDSGYNGTNALKVNGANTTIVPADRDYGRWAYIEITGGSFGIDTSAEIENMTVTFANNDTGGGDSVFFDCVYVVVNPQTAIPIHPTWCEDFNGTGQANPMVWNYEVGYQRNNELQYYVPGPDNGWQESGNFVIEARKDTANAYPGYNYTSASIVTTNKYYWKFGRAQIRAQIPAKAGMWPAIWGTGETGQWPHNGEVDIMEYYADKILANCAVGTTSQWTAKWDSASRTMSSLTAVDPNWKTHWHIWTMQWDDLNVRLYCDNILMNTIPQTWLKNTDGYNTSWGPQYPFQSNGMSCWLNLAIGGNAGGDPTATMNSGPQRYLIDYWKIWEGATNNVAPTDIALTSQTIEEGLPAGTVVGNLSATDADPAEVHRYTLVSGTGSTHNSQFTIPEFVSDNTLQGALKTAVVLNYADGPTRSIRVRVTDIEGATYDKMLTIDVTLTGQHVTYDGNGKTGGSVPVDSNNYSSGAIVTILGNTGALTRTGHTFAGWNTAPNGSGTSYVANDTFSISSNTTLYAQWTPNTYTVSFGANGGDTPSPTSISVTYGSTYGPLATVSHTGHSFDGWFTAASGGTQVTSDTSVAITTDQTLYAHWTLIPVTVVTNTNAIDVPEGASATFQVKLSEQPAGNTTVTVSRGSGDADITVQSGGGLAFTTSNWDIYQTVNLAAAIDGDAQNGTATITCTSSDPAFSAAQVTATEIDKETTLTIASNGNGTTSPSGTVIVEKGVTTGISATANEGYDFVNWTVPSGSANLGSAGSASTTVSITAPATVQANFTPKTYSVTYNGNGNTTGTAPAAQDKIHDQNLILATNTGNLVKTGFSFGGWNTAADDNGTGTDYAAGTTYTGNAPLALYAKWTPGADGTWLPTLAGPFDWGIPANWTGNIVASGADRTASFTPNIADAQVVNLESPRTIGNITFTDSTISTHNLTISGANTLTLSRSSAIPIIDATQSGRTLTISSVVAGSNGLQKNGVGTLILSNASNSYSGGTFINAGILSVTTDGNLGDVAGKITLNGGRLTVPGANFSSARVVEVGAIGGSIQVPGNNNFTTSGKLTGSGALTQIDPGGGGGKALNFNATNNDFTGGIIINGGTGPVFTGNSLLDSANNIAFTATSGTSQFAYGTGAITPLALSTRSIEINSAGALNSTIQNNNTTHAITIATNLVATGAGAKTLTLGAVAGPSNIFSGNITNGSGGGTVALAKTGAGNWSISGIMSNTGGVSISGGTLRLSGTNTYSGNTNFAANGVTLTIAGSQAASPNTTIVMNTNASSAASTLRLLDDGTGTIAFATPVTSTVNNSPGNTHTFFVGNNNTTNGGTSSGTTTGSTLSLPALNIGSMNTTSNIGSYDITGANGYRLQINSVDLNNAYIQGVGVNSNTTFNPTSANVTIGAVTMAAGNALKGIPFLVLGGTSTDNRITGAISNATDALTTGRPLNLTKASTAGVWTLSGPNTYTGNTTISGGLLEIGGNGTLGSGNYNGDISIASTNSGTFKYNSSANQSLGGAITGAGALVKDGAGALTITGPSNTYAGITTVSGGKLFINGSLSNTAVALHVSSGATLGGTGTIGRDVTIAVGGKLEFNLSTDADGHDRLNISTGRSFGFSGASELTITSSGGASIGTYTLITGGNNIGGVAPATLNLPANWTATVSISGNSLVLNVTSTSVVTDPFTVWAVGGVAFDADANGDGIKNGLAWLLGAANPSENALSRLPLASINGTNLRLAFRCLKSIKRGTTQLKVQSSSDLGVSDPWTIHEAPVPDADSTVNGVVFEITDDGDFINVIADIPVAGAKLFGRLQANP